MAAMACRRSGGITVPAGLCPVGMTNATPPGTRPARSIAFGSSPAASAGSGTSRARVPAMAPDRPGYNGQLTSTLVPGSTRPSSHSASCAPVVTMS